MDPISRTNAPGRLSHPDGKFSLFKQRMEISIRFARSGDQNAYQEYTNMMLRRNTHRQTLADRMSAQRGKHRDRIALQRRGLQHPPTERNKSYSLNSHRPLHHLSVRERQGFQLMQEMTERANRHDKAMALHNKTAQSYALLRHLSIPINFSLIHLLDRAVQSRPTEVETLANSLFNLLEMAVPHIVSIGPGCNPAGWYWEAIDKIYAYLHVEAEHGRIPDEWSKYRKGFEELARMVTPVINKPIEVLVPEETAMEVVYEDSYPLHQQEVNTPPVANTSFIAFTLPDDNCSTTGTAMPNPAMASASFEDSSAVVSSHNVATVDDVSSPKVPEDVAANGILWQPSVLGEPVAPTTPIQSWSEAPETVVASAIPHQSFTATAISPEASPAENTTSYPSLPRAESDAFICSQPLEQAAPTPLSNSTVSKETIRAQIMSGTGRFDVNSITSMEDLVSVLNHHRYNVIRIANAKALCEKMMDGHKIDDTDVEFLLRSCQYVLANADAPWFNSDELFDKANEWWECASTGMCRLKSQLTIEIGNRRSEAVKKLEAELQNLWRVFYMPKERKVKPMRKSVRGV